MMAHGSEHTFCDGLFIFYSMTLLKNVMVHTNTTKEQPFQRGDRLYAAESDVCRRQILTYKDGPRTEIIKIFIMVVDHNI